MALYKNISGGGLDVAVPGFERYVEDGETVDIPDFQPDGVSPIEVPLNRWEPVGSAEPAAEEETATEPEPEPEPAPEPAAAEEGTG